MAILKFCSTILKPQFTQVSLLCVAQLSNPLGISYVRRFACKSSGPPWRILFFGSDDFALKSLQALCSKYRTETLISRLGVVTGNENNMVGKFIQDEKLDFSLWPIEESAVKGNYDLGIVVSFGHLIPEEIINSFPLGMINAHASLLPRWRGSSPITYALMNGDSETGVTIMKVSPKKFDRGDIVRQYRCSIAANETNPKLRERLAQHSADLLIECVRDLPKCLDHCHPQPKDGVTYAPKFDKSISRIDWSSMTSRDILNLHRALGHMYPLTTHWKDYPVKFLSFSIDPSDPTGERIVSCDSESIKTASALSFLSVSKKKDHSVGVGKSAVSFLNSDESRKREVAANNSVKPGLVSYNKKRKVFFVECCDGRKIVVDALKVPGKKQLSAADFYNGFLSKESDESKWYFSD
nr:PREDICTED: methionyl-tRNA formyltransferase, mitochondrial-like [Bemisia tabaci]